MEETSMNSTVSLPGGFRIHHFSFLVYIYWNILHSQKFLSFPPVIPFPSEKQSLSLVLKPNNDPVSFVFLSLSSKSIIVSKNHTPTCTISFLIIVHPFFSLLPIQIYCLGNVEFTTASKIHCYLP